MDVLALQATDASALRAAETLAPRVTYSLKAMGMSTMRSMDASVSRAARGKTSITSDNLISKPKPTTSMEIISMKLFNVVKTEEQFKLLEEETKMKSIQIKGKRQQYLDQA